MANGSVNQSDIDAVLAEFKDPESGRSIVQMEQLRDVRLEGAQLSLTLALTTHSAPIWEETRQALIETLQARLPALEQINVELAVHHRPAIELGQVGLKAKSVIVVGSGKGGVGKSTIAVSLALGLKNAGCQVGLMDADVYGPSVPHLLGAAGRPEISERPTGQTDQAGNPVMARSISAVDVDGMKVISIGFLVEPDKAVIWRGPMLHGSITSFLRDTDWGELDYLVIDMPPGTGDVALTLSQILPPTGAVIVCTPQDVALLDAVKAINMFREVRIPVLGMVENMSYFLCPDNDKRYDIFGHGGAEKKAEEMDVPFLGEVPINIQIRVNGDEGNTSANFEDPGSAEPLEEVCRRLVRNLAARHKEEPPLPTLSVL